MDAQHRRDHDRLAAQYDRWQRAGKPRTSNPNRHAAQEARTMGLRIQAHLAVVHKRNDLNAAPTNPLNFDQLLDRHDDLHAAALDALAR